MSVAILMVRLCLLWSFSRARLESRWEMMRIVKADDESQTDDSHSLGYELSVAPVAPWAAVGRQ